jgi:hypothetical protein
VNTSRTTFLSAAVKWALQNLTSRGHDVGLLRGQASTRKRGSFGDLRRLMLLGERVRRQVAERVEETVHGWEREGVAIPTEVRLEVEDQR